MAQLCTREGITTRNGRANGEPARLQVLQVFKRFSQSQQQPSLREVAQETEMCESAVYHHICCLVADGILIRRPGARGVSYPRS